LRGRFGLCAEGESDQAFEWLQRSVALGNENKLLFEHDPNLSGIRAMTGDLSS
jgi:hypothetical protein